MRELGGENQGNLHCNVVNLGSHGVGYTLLHSAWLGSTCARFTRLFKINLIHKRYFIFSEPTKGTDWMPNSTFWISCHNPSASTSMRYIGFQSSFLSGYCGGVNVIKTCRVQSGSFRTQCSPCLLIQINYAHGNMVSVTVGCTVMVRVAPLTITVPFLVL